MPNNGHAIFDSEPLLEILFRRAAEHLQQEGLIRGDAGGAEIPGPLIAQITIKGQECIASGGSVADYLNQRDDRPTSITNNFNDSVTGTIALQSTHVSQAFTMTTGLAGATRSVS